MDSFIQKTSRLLIRNNVSVRCVSHHFSIRVKLHIIKSYVPCFRANLLVFILIAKILKEKIPNNYVAFSASFKQISNKNLFVLLLATRHN